MFKPISHILHTTLLLVFIGAFGSITYIVRTDAPESSAPTVIPPLISTSVPTMVPAKTSAAAEPTGWTQVRPGLERRVIEIYNAQNQPAESLYIWRLDQRHFRLDVAYEDRPKTLEAWQQETDAVIVVNGGYYSIANEKYFPDGLTITAGHAFGRSFRRGGMLAIGPDRADLRWLEREPYDASERLQAALQSFPVLVEPGGVLGFGAERENHAQARRTVIAQDRAGRILLMVAPQGYFTLHQLSAYLTDSDLDLDMAINLDGGGSTGILVADPREVIPPTRPIPFVILVYPR